MHCMISNLNPVQIRKICLNSNKFNPGSYPVAIKLGYSASAIAIRKYTRSTFFVLFFY